MLRHSLPQNIRRDLEELPRTLDETYERMLKEIGRGKRTQAHRLFQCLAVAIRSPRVEELAELLAIDFGGAQGIPKLNKDWRWDDPVHGILSMCCGLVDIVGDHLSNTRHVKFTHFSVKQFLTSDRLAIPNGDLSYFHISPEPAHTVFAQVCLGILLQSGGTVDDERVGSRSPLAEYAAQHWVDHAQFENVVFHLEVGMRCLFDSAEPHFTAWLELYDIDDDWNLFGDHTTTKARGSPLYYASLCGFSDLAAYLIAKHPQYIATTGGLNHSPLAAALHKRHFNVADLLHRHGADVNVKDYERRTPLYAAAAEGSFDVVRWLLDRGAEANSVQDGPSTPLAVAAANGHLEVVRVLLERNADINGPTNDHYTPLHKASENGHLKIVCVLVDYGADVNSQGGNRSTPLHLASSAGSSSTARLLLDHGADFSARDGDQATPLHLASSAPTLETVQLLLERGADVNSRGGNRSTPLHLASSAGSSLTARLLLDHGADVYARDRNHSTPLHLASLAGSLDTVQLLVKCGADIDAQDGNQSTPLHLASSVGWLEIVRRLLELGADVNAQDVSQSTPLHLASSKRLAETMPLIDCGADVDGKNKGGQTPLKVTPAGTYPNLI